VLVIDATDGVLLVHEPPLVGHASELVVPTQRFRLPVIGDGVLLTDTDIVARQPVPRV
jgi:hypothetical protein